MTRGLHIFLAGMLCLIPLATSLAESPVEIAVKASVTAWENGDYATAIRELQVACKLSPTDPELRYNLGVMMLAVGKPKHARHEFERAIGLQPNHVDSLYNLGNLLIAKGELDEGIQLLETAAQHSEDDSGPALAVVAAEVGRNRVDVAWRRAVRIDPKSAPVLSMLAYLSMRRGHSAQALAYALRAQQTEPGVQRHRLVLAHALVADRQYDEALRVITIAERNSETSLANVPYLRGLISFLRLDFTDSEKQWREAIKLAPQAFTKHSASISRVAFPLDADLAYLEAMSAEQQEHVARDLYSHVNVSSGCKYVEVIRGLFLQRHAVTECYRGGLAYDLDLDVRASRVTHVATQTQTRVERCLRRALKGMPVRSARKCRIRMRVGRTMIQD